MYNTYAIIVHVSKLRNSHLFANASAIPNLQAVIRKKLLDSMKSRQKDVASTLKVRWK